MYLLGHVICIMRASVPETWHFVSIPQNPGARKCYLTHGEKSINLLCDIIAYYTICVDSLKP